VLAIFTTAPSSQMDFSFEPLQLKIGNHRMPKPSKAKLGHVFNQRSHMGIKDIRPAQFVTIPMSDKKKETTRTQRGYPMLTSCVDVNGSAGNVNQTIEGVVITAHCLLGTLCTTAQAKDGDGSAGDTGSCPKTTEKPVKEVSAKAVARPGSKLGRVTTSLVRSAASVITSLDRVGCSGSDCDEGSNGKKGGKTREHVWQWSRFLES
jgi:hypothetical protein